MNSILGIVVSENQKLLDSTRRVLEALAKNQTEHGHIPSIVQDKENCGSSDTTLLFLLGVGIFRKVSGEPDFLGESVEKALAWSVKISCSGKVDFGFNEWLKAENSRPMGQGLANLECRT